MTNKELVAALRLCGSVRTCDECLKCPFFNGCGPEHCIPTMTAACADALANSETHVAALQQEIEKLRGQIILQNDELLKLREQVPQWIPVTERLPSDERPVLAYYGFDNAGDGYLGMMFMGTLSYFCFDPCPHWQHASSMGGPVVTNWMPLPEPPKEDEAEQALKEAKDDG